MVTTAAGTMRLFLVGFMGAGKTTLGRRVADRLSLPFFDLDARIEASSGRSIREIFDRDGEPAFRKMETVALEELVATLENAVIATGGGAFTVQTNRDLMRRTGKTIWLDVPTDTLLARVDASARPLWRDEEEVRALYESRRAYYRLADYRLELGEEGPDVGAERLLRLIASQLDP